MKHTWRLSFLFLPIALLLMGSFSLPGDSGRHIQWGSNGSLRYVIYENRQMYKLNDGNIHYESGTILDKKTVKEVFAHLDALKFHKIESPTKFCNFNRVKYVTASTSHEICWEKEEHLGKKNYKVAIFFQKLSELAE